MLPVFNDMYATNVLNIQVVNASELFFNSLNDLETM